MNTILFVGEHPKTYDVRWHTHEHWELVYCTSGQGAFRFENGMVMSYQAGEVVVIPPRTVHANSSGEGFTNIHITMAEPSFPYKSAFRVMDDFEQVERGEFIQFEVFSWVVWTELVEQVFWVVLREFYLFYFFYGYIDSLFWIFFLWL